MTSQKPYLIRAIFEWLVDNHLTPYLLVDATAENVQVPHQFIEDRKIILNIDPEAVRNYHADNEWISFSARFSGKPEELFIPIAAIKSIYAKENNQGMIFPDEVLPPQPPTKTPDKQVIKRPTLSIVK